MARGAERTRVRRIECDSLRHYMRVMTRHTIAREWLIAVGAMVASFLLIILLFRDAAQPIPAFGVIALVFYVLVQFIRLTWWAIQTVLKSAD